MSEQISCENCGAFSLAQTENVFWCNQGERTSFRLADKHDIAARCKHFPVPKPPEYCEFLKWWDSPATFHGGTLEQIAQQGWQACREKFLAEAIKKSTLNDRGFIVLSPAQIHQIAAELDVDEKK